MTAHGVHLLIAAIKYLDGTTNGSEGSTSTLERRQAIFVMLNLLPRQAALDLWSDRGWYWGYPPQPARWIDGEIRTSEIQRRWVQKDPVPNRRPW